MGASQWAGWWTSLRFVAGACLLVGAAYVVSEAADPVYPEMRDRVALFEKRRMEVEVVSVGTSHTRAIDFAAMELPGVHFWRLGQDAFEAGYLARYAASEAPRLRYVLFTASDGFQRVDHGAVARGGNADRRRELYARIPLRRPISGDLEHWASGALSPVVRRDHWLAVVRPSLRRPRVPLTRDGTPREPAPAVPHPDSLVGYAAAQSALHRAIGDEILAEAPDTPERVARYLDALAAALNEQAIVLVLYTPPYHETFLRERDPAIVGETHEALRRIVRRNPNAVWLDFSTDAEFTGDHTLFRDSDHLNPEGARRFSALLRDCLPAAWDGAAGARPGCRAAGRRVPSAGRHRAGGGTLGSTEDPQ